MLSDISSVWNVIIIYTRDANPGSFTPLFLSKLSVSKKTIAKMEQTAFDDVSDGNSEPSTQKFHV